MQTIVMASRKGGAGKTMLGTHLAVEAVRGDNDPVAIIDADPMSGASSRYNRRKSGNKFPTFWPVGEGGLRAALASADQAGIRLMFIDTPPAATEAILAILEHSDLVVIPVIPSPNDLDAIGETVALA